MEETQHGPAHRRHNRSRRRCRLGSLKHLLRARARGLQMAQSEKEENHRHAPLELGRCTLNNQIILACLHRKLDVHWAQSLSIWNHLGGQFRSRGSSSEHVGFCSNIDHQLDSWSHTIGRRDCPVQLRSPIVPLLRVRRDLGIVFYLVRLAVWTIPRCSRFLDGNSSDGIHGSEECSQNGFPLTFLICFLGASVGAFIRARLRPQAEPI